MSEEVIHNKNILVIIPARMGSSRFPGKPMEKILGKPMIGHVYDNVKKNKIISDVAVATCDKQIFDYIKNIGGLPIMTSDEHERASDRCAEALLKIEKNKNIKYDIVVMVQGDEPMIEPEMITEAIKPMLNDEEILVINLQGKIISEKEFQDPNCIKVVCDLNSNALYFSRLPIPSNTRNITVSTGKQICVIPFRRDFLLTYNKLKPTPLEIAESIDMMRVLEHGLKVYMVSTSFNTFAVDTIEDLKKVEKLLIIAK
ncbi:3-deoxy-manno-octulosonate cytidylyltransferase [Candidatus Marinimicrobia bacterium]|nr:3-deoxy-manno-octulosonate cytidylyltransferase [Candidatus Neomarinimicrobiota bacterium]